MMDQKPPFRKDIVEAWNRFVNRDYTIEDVSLIIDSVRSDDHFQEFKEVSDRIWNEALVSNPTLTEEGKEAYRNEIAQLIANYENRQQAPATIPLKSAGKRRRWLYAAAAAILLCILIPTAILFQKPKADNYIIAVTKRGEISYIDLPDQTKVTLNAGSTLKYPENFSGAERTVELSGEALFDVTSNPSHPFSVKTDNMNIRVLGTVFNVSVYRDDASSTVSVISGKVEVDVANSKILLEKNQQVKMNNVTHNFEKLSIDTDKYLAWLDGKLYFDRTSIKDVVNILNRQYPQSEIVLAEGDYSNYSFSGIHDNKRLESVLHSIIFSTGLQCKKQENKYTIYPK